MGKTAEFKMANYDGGMPSHPDPEESGKFILTEEGQWQLHYGNLMRKRWIYAGWERYPVTFAETGPSSCHATIRDTRVITRSCGCAI